MKIGILEKATQLCCGSEVRCFNPSAKVNKCPKDNLPFRFYLSTIHSVIIYFCVVFLKPWDIFFTPL